MALGVSAAALIAISANIAAADGLKLERIGGILVYDISDPASPIFRTYQNDRDFTMSNDDIEDGLGLGLGPEGLTFIEAADNDYGVPLVVVANGGVARPKSMPTTCRSRRLQRCSMQGCSAWSTSPGAGL